MPPDPLSLACFSMRTYTSDMYMVYFVDTFLHKLDTSPFVIPHGVLPTVHIWTGKNWLQYYAGHVGTTALLLSQNGLRSNLRASTTMISENSWRSMPPDPILLYAYMHIRYPSFNSY